MQLTYIKHHLRANFWRKQGMSWAETLQAKAITGLGWMEGLIPINLHFEGLKRKKGFITESRSFLIPGGEGEI